MIDSATVKATVAAYWRFQHQCNLVAFEAPETLEAYGAAADILAVDGRRFLIETEVKVSISDLRADIKKPKHQYFRKILGKDYKPTKKNYFGGSQLKEPEERPVRYFYFAVPKELANETILICEQLYPYAGVLGTNGHNTGQTTDVTVYRKAELLPGEKLNWSLLRVMIRSQSATVCRLARDLAEEREGGKVLREKDRNLKKDTYIAITEYLKSKYGGAGRNASRTAAYKIAKELAISLELSDVSPFLEDILRDRGLKHGQ
jgi:predicted DNA-binding ribbon-helix-helix protein